VTAPLGALQLLPFLACTARADSRAPGRRGRFAERARLLLEKQVRPLPSVQVLDLLHAASEGTPAKRPIASPTRRVPRVGL